MSRSRSWAASSLVIGALLRLSAPPPALGAPPPNEKAPLPFEVARTFVRPWYSRSTVKVRTSFPAQPPVARSEAALGTGQDYQDARNLILLAGAELRLTRWLLVDLQYGNSVFGHGAMQDRLWVHAPNTTVNAPVGVDFVRPANYELSHANAGLTSQTSLVGTSAYVRVFSWPRKKSPWEFQVFQYLDVFLGHSWHDERFDMKPWVYTASDLSFAAYGPHGTFGAAASAYRFHYEGLQLGFREEAVFPYGFSASCRVAWSPVLKYRGEGFWAANAGANDGTPDFVHTTEGHSVDVDGSVSWSPVRYVSVDLGFLWHSFKTDPGAERSTLANGLSTEATLDSVTLVRNGFFFSTSVKY